MRSFSSIRRIFGLPADSVLPWPSQPETMPPYRLLSARLVSSMAGRFMPLPVVIGLDMAGEITEVGTGVTGWAVGDRVLVSKYGGTEIKVDGKEYKLASADDVLAVLS